jgi:hypothetical protein
MEMGLQEGLLEYIGGHIRVAGDCRYDMMKAPVLGAVQGFGGGITGPEECRRARIEVHSPLVRTGGEASDPRSCLLTLVYCLHSI